MKGKRRTYGNGERYFLRKLRSSYGILIRMNVFLTYFFTETAMECWKPGVTRQKI